MTRYRIIRRAGFLHPQQPIYDVECQVLWWWESAGSCFTSFDGAKQHILELQAAEATPIKREIVYEHP